jgi:hypothetical protein
MLISFVWSALAIAPLPVYVIHDSRNVERKRALVEQFEREKLEVDWIGVWSVDELNALEPAALQLLYDQYRFLREGETQNWCLANKITMKHVSVLLKHHEAFKRAAEAGHPYSLILEDDVKIASDFVNRVQGYISALPSPEQGGWDILSIGDGNPAMHFQGQEPGQAVYQKTWTQGPIFAVSPWNVMRSADSYLVSSSCAAAFAKSFLPAVFPIDNHLNYVLNSNKMKVFWAGRHTLTVQAIRIDAASYKRYTDVPLIPCNFI